ncbi:T9SS type B sorting domain-containing protein [Portibacter lacus]|uniref:Gliding motility-associated C-terminal domain-containing protein n=1 Tax=Portibacter lacus TaxID=1099794 RepID=A0AA37WC09_9BACT|nr:gliding motility-associated C-terminal domain-containing protein [Portibacter lacus]GLR15643.1 hypothetical protein GCM10007940_02580 [Portibacter lacus]
MRNGTQGRLLFVLLFLIGFGYVSGQTTIFSETFNEPLNSTSGTDQFGTGWNATCAGCLSSGGRYSVQGGVLEQNNSEGPAIFSTNSINISNCNTLTVRMNYVGQPYAGSGNFESPDECDFGMPCAGDTDNPLAGDCAPCWDFFLVELVYNGGVRETVRLIGNGDNPTTALIDYTSSCVGNKNSVSLEIKSQTWASAETNTTDNIMIICNDPTTGQQPVTSTVVYCDGETVDMSISPVGGATSYQWYDNNDNPISGANSTNLSFTANDALGSPQNISYIASLSNGCKVSGDLNIIVNPSPTATLPGSISVCQGDNISIPETGGNSSWSWSGPGPGNPGNNSTWNINNAQPSASGSYIVTVTDAGCSSTAFTNVTVNPGGAYTISTMLPLCENDGSRMLNTVQDGNPGNWSGSGVSSNSFDPSSVGPGTYSITFTPTSAGCLSPQAMDVTVNNSPNSSVPTSPLESCGLGMASFDLTNLNNEVNGGSGETVIWYEQANQVDEILDPTNYTAVSSTVYAVVSDGICFSDEQQLDLLVTDGPDIMMSPTIDGCESVTVNAITILNESGNQAYYDMPGGMGTQYLPGHVFTEDITIYAYDENGACTDEQEIVITVGKLSEAGPDVAIDTCIAGVIDLQSLVDPSADSGKFSDIMGNPVPDFIDPDTLTVNGLNLTYTTISSGVCSPDEAKYTIGLFAGNDAGDNASTTICTNETIDINTLTTDNGASGFFIFTDGTTNPQTTFMMAPGDPPFQLEFYYIVDVLGSCDPDSALIIVEGLEAKSTLIDGMVCPDFETEVFGVMYYSGNTSGMEMGMSSTGCDSIVNIDLTFRPENRFNISDVLCIGNDITVNGVVYNETNPIGEEFIIGGDQFGCDSIIEIDLTFDSEVTTLIDFSLCEGQDTIINGKLYNQADATGSANFVSSTGCDSIVNVDLSFAQSSEFLISETICIEDSLVIENEVFNHLRKSGMFLSESLNAAGCDSFIMVELIIDDSFLKIFDNELCSDESININNITYNAANPFGFDTISNAGACDSVYVITLNFLPADTSYIEGSFCNDTSFIVNGATYDRNNSQGMEVVSGGAASGCNEYIFIDLEFIDGLEVTLEEELCLDDSIVVNDVVYNAANPTGQEMLLSSNGCDSLVNINLTFQGMDVAIISSLPDCDYASLGELEIDINEGAEFLMDILLNGVSVLEEYQANTRLLNLQPGDYTVEFVDIRGCSQEKYFTIYNVSISTLSVDATIVNDSYYQISTNFTGQIESIRWTPSSGLSCVDCENPEAMPDEETTYVVEIADENGCTFQDSVTLQFILNSVLYQPNIFSPNDDGVNDIFFIDSDQAFEFSSFTIFDRWGNMMFKEQNGVTGDASVGWDGYQNLQGVYIYVMIVEFPDGPETITGEFSLVR